MQIYKPTDAAIESGGVRRDSDEGLPVHVNYHGGELNFLLLLFWGGL